METAAVTAAKGKGLLPKKKTSTNGEVLNNPNNSAVENDEDLPNQNSQAESSPTNRNNRNQGGYTPYTGYRGPSNLSSYSRNPTLKKRWKIYYLINF